MRLVILFLSFFHFTIAASANEDPLVFSSGSSCPISLPDTAPNGGWTQSEVYAWERICTGKPADMRLQSPTVVDEQPCEPWKIPDIPPEHRLISSEFIELIVSRKSWALLLPNRQVTVQCAIVDGELNLEALPVLVDLSIIDSHLLADINLMGAQVGGSISFDGSKIEGTLKGDRLRTHGNIFLRNGQFGAVRLPGARIFGNLNIANSEVLTTLLGVGLKLDGHLFARSGSTFNTVNLFGARISGETDFADSSVADSLSMNNARLEGNLRLSGASRFGNVQLNNSDIGGNIYAVASTVEGSFSGTLLSVDGNVFLNNGANFFDVNLRSAKIGGIIHASNSKFGGHLTADRAQVGGGVFLRGNAEFKDISLVSAAIQGHVQLAGSTFSGEVDLSGAHMQELILFIPEYAERENFPSGSAVWVDEARLVLRNAKANAVQSRPESWKVGEGWLPVDLGGFEYQRLAGLKESGESTMINESADGLLTWLRGVTRERKGFDPQPYEQLSYVLENAGMNDKARRVRYEKFLHRDSRKPVSSFFDYFSRLTERYMIGYGIYPFRILYWFFGIVVFGVFVGCFSNSANLRPLKRKVWYSVENALPLVEFSDSHDGIKHDNSWVESYFHVQKILGFILATVLIGALSLLPG